MKIIKNESLSAIKTQIRQQTAQTTNSQVAISVANIISDVRQRGDAALRDYSVRFDGVALNNLKVSELDIDSAIAQVPDEVIAALKKAADNVT